MGTHPIFESDFDCLTDKVREKEKLFENLQQRVKETWRT